jgi:Tfp pilus assembly protein PilO
VRPEGFVQQIRRQQTEARQEQQLREDVAAALTTLEQQRPALAEGSDAGWLLQELSRLVKDAHLEVTSITPHPPSTAGEGVAIVSASLQFATTYHQLGRFVARLERHERFLRIDALQITPNVAQPGKVNVRVTVSAVALPSSPIPVTSGAADAPS